MFLDRVIGVLKLDVNTLYSFSTYETVWQLGPILNDT